MEMAHHSVSIYDGHGLYSLIIGLSNAKIKWICKLWQLYLSVFWLFSTWPKRATNHSFRKKNAVAIVAAISMQYARLHKNLIVSKRLDGVDFTHV